MFHYHCYKLGHRISSMFGILTLDWLVVKMVHYQTIHSFGIRDFEKKLLCFHCLNCIKSICLIQSTYCQTYRRLLHCYH
jgi:hypothetical protein